MERDTNTCQACHDLREKHSLLEIEAEKCQQACCYECLDLARKEAKNFGGLEPEDVCETTCAQSGRSADSSDDDFKAVKFEAMDAYSNAASTGAISFLLAAGMSALIVYAL